MTKLLSKCHFTLTPFFIGDDLNTLTSLLQQAYKKL